ncbi:MbcA/ParS/Xre antitoxin family protein [Pararhizobium sp. IMCC21322]|uniref:MbcA/ParS/Xre antitoxin family protein n=1 Tax=Pararhizobium sp. IMCC21322 TaxID=3067903 RepID=UPI0027403DE4|nr:MbcA/ParS/Xre antitoxin family protein [Pararhizobium sp. IMCC21322]
MPADTQSQNKTRSKDQTSASPANGSKRKPVKPPLGDQAALQSFGENVISLILTDSIEANVNLGQAIRNGVTKSIIEERPALIKSMVEGGVLPRSTVEDAKKSQKDTLSPTNSERIVRVLRMRKQASDALGENRADGWMDKPNRNFGGSSAIQMAKTEAGARAVEQFLLQLTHGFNA